ncbi:cell wall metabolism sensor histidine kinase WalK [Peptococcaceae bacterium]|nr:cell wall metabolism sensor histidine kinase WalK [Peptococcaceae bacterium]
MLKPSMKTCTVVSYFVLFLLFVIAVFFVAYTGYKYIGAVIVLIAVATAISAYLTFARLIKPIEEMISAAVKMAKGMLEIEINIDGNDEISKLASSINVLAKRLKQNMVSINEERNRANAILKSMGDAVIALDRNGCIIMINPAFEKIFGVSTKKAFGKRAIEVIRSYELDSMLRAVIKNRQPVDKEIKILLPSPKEFKIHATPLVGDDGIMSGVVALMRDITERKQLENMRNEFVANVSHELRTPLTSINGFLETLLDGAVEDVEVAKRFLGIMKKETDRLTRLVDDLLKFAKLADKKFVLNKQKIDIDEIANQTVQLFTPRAHEKNIKINLNICKSLPKIEADKDLLMQVFINLIDNAIKHTPVGGVININIDFDNDVAKVSVSDTGPGIPINSIKRIFERFYRIDKSRNRDDGGGTGLGLAIAKHAVELHGGKIWAENTGKGAVFIFTLPYNTEEKY